MSTIELEAPPPAALSPQMQTYAQGYIDARKRAGYAWLDMGRFLSEARAEAKYGEWKVFLEATNTSQDAADRLMAIYEQSRHSAAFADAVRTNFLTVTTAYELATAPEGVRDQLLSQEQPPTRQQIRDEKRAANSAPARSSAADDRQGATETPDDLRKNGVQMVKHGSWWQPVGFSGALNGWVGKAEPWDLAVHAAREEIERRAKAAQPNLPDLSDILKRLDAHGYARSSTRQKGITTFYSFRDYSGRSDETGGEVELAEGELPIWLSELDSHAAYAQAKQERYLDAQARAERLGYDLKRDGARFVLTPSGQKVPALVGTLDQLIKTIEGYEKNAAKAAQSPAPTLADLDASLPKHLEKAGYFWHSATPLVIAHNDGWRGDAPTVELALEAARDREKARTVTPAAPALDDWWNQLRAIERAMQHKKLGDACAATFQLLRLISGGDPKTRAAALLIAIEREMKDLATDDQEGLSQAISDLNECMEGTEVNHWLGVGYALLDLEATE